MEIFFQAKMLTTDIYKFINRNKNGGYYDQTNTILVQSFVSYLLQW